MNNSAVYLLYDKQVKNWVKELKKMLGEDIALCIAGNNVYL